MKEKDVVERHLEVVVEDNTETMVDIINNKVDQSHGGGQRNPGGRGSHGGCDKSH
jgi:hypothetical protein